MAPRVVALLDRPRPVLAIPRWRGVFVRLIDFFPGLGLRMMPLFMADARRRQRRWKKRVDAGELPAQPNGKAPQKRGFPSAGL